MTRTVGRHLSLQWGVGPNSAIDSGTRERIREHKSSMEICSNPARSLQRSDKLTSTTKDCTSRKCLLSAFSPSARTKGTNSFEINRPPLSCEITDRCSSFYWDRAPSP